MEILSPAYRWREEDPFHFWRFSLLSFQSYWTWDPPLFTGKLVIKFQNIQRNTTQVIIRHRVQILFSVISSPITLERQKWKLSKMKGRIPFFFDDFHFCRSRAIGLDMTENRIFTLCRMITWGVFLRMFWNFISSLPVKRGGSLSFLTIFTFAVPTDGQTDGQTWWNQYTPLQLCCGGYKKNKKHSNWKKNYKVQYFELSTWWTLSVCRQILCRTITWVVLLRIF
jgi:hypothetical protein